MAEKVNLSKSILSGIEEWADKAHSSRFFDFYRKLLGIQAEVEAKAGLPELKLDKAEITERLKSGHPLLASDSFVFDRELASDAFGRLCRLFGEYPEMLGPVPAELCSHGLSAEWVKAWFAGENIPSDGEAVHPLLVSTMVQQTLRPFLIGYGQALKGKFRQDDWRRAICPVCGAKPEFSYLEKEVGARWCLCSACATEWLFKRLECPYCGNNDSSKLSYLTSDDGQYRVYLCEVCKTYLKTIDLRKAAREVLMPMESLTTVELDAQAQEKGYHRGA